MEYRLNLIVNGETMADLVEAMEEATRRVRQGNMVGFDSNETGDFSYEISDGE